MKWVYPVLLTTLLASVLASVLALSACGQPRNDNLAVKPAPTAIERISEDDAAGEPAQPEDVQPAAATPEPAASEPETATESGAAAGMMGEGGSPGMGQGMGQGGMRAFHMAPIAAEYAGRLSPVPADAESIARGETLYAQNCATCHGETGLGDGPAAAALDPAPPMIAMTSQMLGDDYMLWRISEGGGFEPYNSAMPAWKAVIAEETRWDVINYVRSLGSGDMMSMDGPGMGMDAATEEAMRAEMLAAGIEQGVISADQAEQFDTVHAQIDALRAADPDRQFAGTMKDLQDQLLEELVAAGEVSQEDADAFNHIHDLLEDSGLMP